jgi:hypothetical protein
MRQLTPYFNKIYISNRTAIVILLLILVSSGASLPENTYSGYIKLNPEFKIKRMSNGEVIVTSKNEDGAEFKQQFTGFYADLLLAAYKKHKMEFILDSFSKKYFLSEDECRRQIKHALNVLSEWKIIIPDKKLTL